MAHHPDDWADYDFWNSQDLAGHPSSEDVFGQAATLAGERFGAPSADSARERALLSAAARYADNDARRFGSQPAVEPAVEPAVIPSKPDRRPRLLTHEEANGACKSGPPPLELVRSITRPTVGRRTITDAAKVAISRNQDPVDYMTTRWGWTYERATSELAAAGIQRTVVVSIPSDS